jgi:iduronate 2-sulfatase
MKTRFILSALISLIIPGSGCTLEKQDRISNVLFIAIDDLNDWTGAMNGHPQAITPNLDDLCNEGLLFTNAHCSQAVCIASRNSLLSGLHPSTTGWYSSRSAMQRFYEQVMQEHKMLPQYFKDNGYKTMTVGKIYHRGASDYPDRTEDFWDETAAEYNVPEEFRERGDGYGGIKFYPFPRNGSQIVNHYGEDFNEGHSLCWGALEREDMPGGKMYDEMISEWAAERLSEDHNKPFFLAVGFVRPHVPYTAPKEYFDLYNLDDINIPEVPEDEMADIPLMGKSIAFGTIRTGDHSAVTNLSDAYWKEMVYAYLACVTFVDEQVGRVLEALENSLYADNTIVVLWSDHGQHLGEKKHWRKQALWEESTRVPLYFRVPEQKSGGLECDRVVSLLDIYPTLVDLCGLPQAEMLEGQSLAPLIRNPDLDWRKPVLSTWYYKNHSVRSENWRYIRYRDGSEELYDHRKDPGEHINLAGDPEYASVIAEHKQWLPEDDALPAGSDLWEGDKLDRRIQEWTVNDSIPVWLR